MKRILLIGGTGIIGKAVIEEALKQNYEIIVLGLDKPGEISEKVKQIIVDRNDEKEFRIICDNLGKFDVVLDIFEFSKENAKQTYDYFKSIAKHIFIISTVLVYDRSKNYKLPIESAHPLAKKGTLGGYVDHKLDIENFWKNKEDANWTILRPYHILGVHDSLLGCIPDHNRDPELLHRIKNELPLYLCEGGNIKFNFIDTRDIVKAIFVAANNPKTFRKCYNLVNPEIILAKRYYEIIGEELGKKVIIKNKSIREVWKENKGWQLTTLPHVYDVGDLKKDIGFVPSIPLKETIKEILKSYKPENKAVSEIAVHKRMTLLPRPKPIKWLTEGSPKI